MQVSARMLPLPRLLEVVIHHFPKLQLTSDSGLALTVGKVGEPIAITASSANLLGWLTRRTDASAVTGGGGLQLPAF